MDGSRTSSRTLWLYFGDTTIGFVSNNLVSISLLHYVAWIHTEIGLYAVWCRAF